MKPTTALGYFALLLSILVFVCLFIHLFVQGFRVCLKTVVVGEYLEGQKGVQFVGWKSMVSRVVMPCGSEKNPNKENKKEEYYKSCHNVSHTKKSPNILSFVHIYLKLF
jgi:hypothetical protein